jgi:AbrB family looped-hinge helix DNA binding protein
MTTKGQVTIPASIRKELGLKPHDKVMFRLENGAVRLEPAGSIVQARSGIAKLKKPFKDARDLRSQVEEAVVEEVLREMSQ